MSKPRRKIRSKPPPAPSPETGTEPHAAVEQPTGFEEHPAVANEPPERPPPSDEGPHDYDA